jgi:hypothetical protein
MQVVLSAVTVGFSAALCAYRLNEIGETKNIVYIKYFLVDIAIMS